MDRVRIFIDFWNFQLNWNDYVGSQQQIDWKKLPIVIIDKSKQILNDGGINTELQLLETCVYTSITSDKPNLQKMKLWLNNTLDRFPGYRVFIKERKSRVKSIHCSSCGGEIKQCPICKSDLTSSIEKGVDTQIVTDLMSQAWEKTYDIGLLLSGDSDFVPAVERLQEKGIKIINAAWKLSGNLLAQKCWASFHLDDISGELKRE